MIVLYYFIANISNFKSKNFLNIILISYNFFVSLPDNYKFYKKNILSKMKKKTYEIQN